MDELGRAVVATMQGSISGVPHPKDFGKLLQPILDLAGFRSKRQYEVGALAISVEEQLPLLRFVPSKREDGGHSPIRSRIIEIPADASAAQIGESATLALSRSE